MFNHSKHACKSHQEFCNSDLLQSGFLTTAPAQSFQPNGYGLYHLCGNVREWTAPPFRARSKSKKHKDHAKQMTNKVSANSQAH